MAREFRWNTVVRSPCGHRYVRRYTYVAMLLFLHDPYPVWKHLRPWHVVANVRILVRWAAVWWYL